MWEYFVQNKDLWILAVIGVAAILTTLYYQIFEWRRNDRSLKVSLLATFTLAVAGTVVLPWHVPYPPFTWQEWSRENLPSNCREYCWQQDLYIVAFFLSVLVIGAVCVVILWCPWWLSRLRR